MLKHRILSGCLLGAAFVLAANYLPAAGVWVILAGISFLAQREFYSIASQAGVPVFRHLGVVCGTALISATFLTIGPGGVARAYRWELVVLLGSLIAVFVRQFPQKHNDRPLATIGCTLLGIWYVPFLFNFFTRLTFAWDGTEGYVSVTGKWLVLYLVSTVKSADIGAYFVGKLVGRNKLFVRISPGKTWEGLFGGVALAVFTSLGFYLVSGGQFGKITLGLTDAILLGVLLAWVGVVGDMFESLLKRAAGAKDSSGAVPGMGGILDVLDSLLFGAPVLYVYAELFLA